MFVCVCVSEEGLSIQFPPRAGGSGIIYVKPLQTGDGGMDRVGGGGGVVEWPLHG